MTTDTPTTPAAEPSHLPPEVREELDVNERLQRLRDAIRDLDDYQGLAILEEVESDMNTYRSRWYSQKSYVEHLKEENAALARVRALAGDDEWWQERVEALPAVSHGRRTCSRLWAELRQALREALEGSA